MLLSPGISIIPCHAEQAPPSATLPDGIHPLGVTLLTGDGTFANGFVWLKGENGETTPVELVDGYASFSMTPEIDYELRAMLATTDGAMVEWSQSFHFQEGEGVMWLKSDGSPLAVYPADSIDESVRDLFCLLPDAPHAMKIKTSATDNLLQWDFLQFDSFTPVMYEVYHNGALTGETATQTAVVSVVTGDNTYTVAAVDAQGERRYGEILTLSLENDSDADGGDANATSNLNPVGKNASGRSGQQVSVYATNPDGSAAGLVTMAAHQYVEAETYYSKTNQGTFYYMNPTLFDRTIADGHFLTFIKNSANAKWGKKFYCSVCGSNSTSGEHSPSYASNVSWVHCFGLFNAAPVNHVHPNRAHVALDAVDSSVSGGNYYVSFPYLTQTAEAVQEKPNYWVQTTVHNVILDLDVDSNNDGTIDYNKKNYESTEDRDEATSLGKVFLSTYHDRNGNGQIDCFENVERITTPADFTLFNSPPAMLYTRATSDQLVMLVTKIPGPPLQDTKSPGTVTFTYSDSPPYGDSMQYVDVVPEGVMGARRYMLRHDCTGNNCSVDSPCLPPGGSLRLWCSYGGKRYFIPSGAGLNAARASNATFYVEGVKAASSEQISISFSAMVTNGIDSLGKYTSQSISPPDDIINVTPFTITWEPICRDIIGEIGSESARIVNPAGTIASRTEHFRVNVEPDGILDEKIKWKDRNSSDSVVMTGENPSISSPSLRNYDLYIDVYDYFSMNSIINQAPKVGLSVLAQLDQDFFFYPQQRLNAIPIGEQNSLVTGTNTILCQAGFKLNQVSKNVDNGGITFASSYHGTSAGNLVAQIRASLPSTLFTQSALPVCLTNSLSYAEDDNVYEVFGISDNNGGKPYLILAQTNGLFSHTFAHEYLHYKGTANIYHDDTSKLTSSDCQSAYDWGNGYYLPLSTNDRIVERLLMCTNLPKGNVKYDIPNSAINGVAVGITNVR